MRSTPQERDRSISRLPSRVAGVILGPAVGPGQFAHERGLLLVDGRHQVHALHAGVGDASGEFALVGVAEEQPGLLLAIAQGLVENEEGAGRHGLTPGSELEDLVAHPRHAFR